jgi:hypothetical protein
LGPGCALRVHVHTALQGVQAPVSDWYNAPDRWQIQYVAAIVDAGNSTGIRCPGTVTVGAIRYELLTRVNQGRIQGTDLVYDQIQKILSEAGCVTNTGTKIVPLQVVPREAAAPIVVPPQPVPYDQCGRQADPGWALRKSGCTVGQAGDVSGVWVSAAMRLGLAREFADTHDPEIPEEIFELARRLKEMEH